MQRRLQTACVNSSGAPSSRGCAVSWTASKDRRGVMPAGQRIPAAHSNHEQLVQTRPMLLAIATPLYKPETSEASTERMLGILCGAAGRLVDCFSVFPLVFWPVEV